MREGQYREPERFKAVNNRDRNFTSAKLKRRMEEIESKKGQIYF
jgi:hypothetical protein